VKEYLRVVEVIQKTFEPQGLTVLSGVELGKQQEFLVRSSLGTRNDKAVEMVLGDGRAQHQHQ
jgi:hypothetical protein